MISERNARIHSEALAEAFAPVPRERFIPEVLSASPCTATVCSASD